MPELSYEPYPSLLSSTQAAGRLISLARAGEIYTKGRETAKCGYVIVGGGLKQFVGEPDGVPETFGEAAESEPLSDEQAHELRTSLQTAVDEAPAEGTFGADAAAIDPAMLTLILQFVLAFLNRKKS